MRTRNSCLAKIMRPREKTCVPIRVILRFRELCDHDIVYVEYDIKAKRIKQASPKIYLYKREDMVCLKDHMAQFKDAYLSEDHSHMSVNDMWVKFKIGF